MSGPSSAVAIHQIGVLPVLNRNTQTHAAGIVTLAQLLASRRRDQQEARDRERTSTFRTVRQ